MKEEQTMPNWIRLDNDQVVETTDTGVAVSPVRTNGMSPYLVRIIA